MARPAPRGAPTRPVRRAPGAALGDTPPTLRAGRARGPSLGRAHAHVADQPVSRGISGSLSQGSAAEADLVAVRIAEYRLAHAVRVGLSLRGLEFPLGDLRDARIEV